MNKTEINFSLYNDPRKKFIFATFKIYLYVNNFPFMF